MKPPEHGERLTHLVSINEISRALDEIYAMRRQAALEAQLIDQILDYRTLPASARDQLAGLRNRLVAIARGYVLDIGTHSSYEGQQALRQVGARATLTRGTWKEEWTA